MTYKEFIGSVHFSADDRVFHGKIEGVDDLVTFEGVTADELIKAFREEEARKQNWIAWADSPSSTGNRYDVP